MAVIPQKQLFGWEEIENLGDLERLRQINGITGSCLFASGYQVQVYLYLRPKPH